MLDSPERRDPEDVYAAPDAKETAAALTFTAQVSQNRSIVIQTYMARDAPVVMYHDVLDKLAKAVNRQEAVLDLESHELNLRVEEDKLKLMKEDFLRIETVAGEAWERSGKKGAFKLGPKEDSARKTSMVNIDRFTDAIAKRKLDIAKLKAIISHTG